MAEVKWIKLMVDVFNNRKVEQIEVMPDGDGIIVIWFKLLCLAGSVNDDGAVYFTQEVPYTEEMLATQFRRPIALVRLAIRVFMQFGMVDVVDNIIHISNWEKYQNADKLNEIRDYNRLAQQKHRAQKKLKAPVNDKSMTSQPCQGTDIELDKELDKEKESKKGASAPTHPRMKHGEYGWVRLTTEEYVKLLKDLGPDEVTRCIYYVDESAQASGNKNKWKDWNLVIRKCSRDKWGLHGKTADTEPTPQNWVRT